MSLRVAVAAILLLAACGDSSRSPEVVVRVSATSGLGAFEPATTSSGSTAAALDLVFEPVSAHGSIQRVDGHTIIIDVRDENADELASLARHAELIAAEGRGSQLTATFVDEKSARMVADLDDHFFETGPFRVEREAPHTLRLVRRRQHPIDAIEIVETSQEDEWRKLMARELDVIPAAASAFRKELSGIDSIRVFDIPAISDVTLFFNVRDEKLRDVAVRRKIASLIHRDALARLACGDERCAAPPIDSPGDVALPSSLTLSVIENDATLMIASRALKYQLGALGLEVELRPASIASLEAGDYELTITPLVRGSYRYVGFASPAPGKASITGFSNADLDAAFAAGDLATAQRVLDEQMPVTALFEYRKFAAVDARFCGDVTPSGSSWRWIADLRPCETDE